MTPERWARIEALLDAALELSPGARGALLDDPASADSDVRAEVRRLIGLSDDAERFLEESAAEYAAPLIADEESGEDPPPVPAGPVGPYRILGEAGQGGMGTVYLAERDDEQFRQRVALKLVRGASVDEHLLRRFREERQILASLEHPHIARLLDGGVTAEGLPYFAMEYVPGVPIDRYCDEGALAVEARIELFRTVCDAVQYAHRNLVVHRDLKPSNILVTEAGEAKLLDFGIAKLLDPALQPAGGAMTRPGNALLTPEYASPEQLRGEAVTTTTDVYSLGVLLYLLLAGRMPYARADRHPRALARAILETEPERPSAVAPAALRRRLRGDLDTIVLRALHRDPERRYPSAQALAADLGRHLAGQPVQARPDTLRYRAGKFVRRNRAGVAAAAAFAAVAVGFGAYHAVAITRERDAAQRQAAKAEQVAGFLVELFQQSDPLGPAAATLSVADFLRIGAERLERELVDQPEVRASMMGVIASVYGNLGRYDEAAALYKRALEIQRAALPREDPEIAVSLDGLGTVLLRSGDLAAADSLLTTALAIRRARFGERNLTVAEAINNLASLRNEQREYAAADSLYGHVLAIRRELLGEANPEVALVLNNLGIVARGRGDFTAAEAHHREALALRRAHFGDEHALVAISTRNLALALHSQSRYAEARTLYGAALELQVRLLGESHPEVAMTMQSLASLLRMEGDYQAADPLYRRALELQRASIGPAHPRLANTLDNLAALLRERGDLGEAERLARESLAMRRGLLNAGHPSVALGQNSLGVILRDQGRHVEAESLIGEAVEILRSRLGPDHQFTGTVLSNLGSVAHRKEDYAAAATLYRQSLAILRADSAGAHVDAARAMIGLGDVLVLLGRAADAEPLLREAIELRRAHLPAGHWAVAEAQVALGHCLRVLARDADAEPLLRSGFEMLDGREGLDQSRSRRRAAEQLASLHTAAGRGEEARRWRSRIPR